MSEVVVIFCYNRSYHVKRVLDALANNTIFPEKLYIFQDGKNDKTDKVEWHKVSEIISDINWCDCEVHISEQNKGLSQSIVDGINYVFTKHESLIVLEDDCVPHREYLRYMNICLNKYKNDKNVFCVTGCAEEVDINEDEYDVFFMRRGSSLGWGTWVDRWRKYTNDYNIIKRIAKDPEKNARLQNWGPDLRNILVSNIEEETDSWAVFWDLTIINFGGYTVCPFYSLIDNIGFDGSGVHSNIRNFDIKLREEVEIDDFLFPDVIEEKEEYMEAFKLHYTRLSERQKLAYYNSILTKWIRNSINQKRLDLFLKSFDKLALWGTGDICDLLIEDLGETIHCIVLSQANIDSYRGIRVVTPKEIERENIDGIVVIPGFAMQKIKAVCNKYGINTKLIELNGLMDNLEASSVCVGE